MKINQRCSTADLQKAMGPGYSPAQAREMRKILVWDGYHGRTLDSIPRTEWAALVSQAVERHKNVANYKVERPAPLTPAQRQARHSANAADVLPRISLNDYEAFVLARILGRGGCTKAHAIRWLLREHGKATGSDVDFNALRPPV